MVLDLYKVVHCVDLGESFPTSIYSQNLASIQPRTSPVKFAQGGPVVAAAARTCAEEVAASTSEAWRQLVSRL